MAQSDTQVAMMWAIPAVEIVGGESKVVVMKESASEAQEQAKK